MGKHCTGGGGRKTFALKVSIYIQNKQFALKITIFLKNKQTALKLTFLV